jgi:hypothetical protein
MKVIWAKKVIRRIAFLKMVRRAIDAAVNEWIAPTQL